MKKERGVGYGLLLAAGLFLWNPVTDMTDLLPDLFGYLLLLWGLARLGDLNDALSEARRRFRGALWIGVGEFAVQLLLRFFLRSATVADDPYRQNYPAWTLLFTFAAAVLECYFLIPAYRELFRGLGALAERQDAAHLQTNAKTDRYERMMVFSTVFVVGKNLLSLLPELTSVTTYEAELENPWIRFDWYQYINVTRLILLVPALVLTVWWLVSWIRLFRAALRDLPFQATVRAIYNERVLPDRGLLLARRVRLAFLLVQVGAAFTAPLILTSGGENARGFSFLPDWAAILFFAAALLLLRDLVPIRRWEMAVGGAAFAAGVAEWAVCLRYYARYTATDARYLTAAYDSMTVLRVVGTVSAVLTAAAAVVVLLRTKSLIRDHLCTADEGPLSQTAVARIRADYRPRAVLAGFFVVLTAAGKIADLFLRPWLAWFWWIPALSVMALVLVLSSLSGDLAQALASRYPPLPQNAGLQ